MAVRIYALAKELKLDSKVLAEMCSQAGVTGKGSALASLTDDEEEKIRAFVAGGGRPGKPAAAHKPAASSAATLAPPPTVVRREDYLAPGGTFNKPPLLAPKLEKDKVVAEVKKKAPAAESPKPPVKVAPTIKLAPLPQVQQPAPPPSNEPAPQKPDIKLPADAIRASKAGSKPLSEHIRKHDEKRKAEAAKKADSVRKGEPQRPAAEAAPGKAPLGMAGRDRGRRGGGKVTAGPTEEADGLASREQRQKKRGLTGRKRSSGDDDDSFGSRQRRSLQHRGTNTAAPRKTNVVLQLPCTVRSFSEAIGISGAKVLGKLLAMQMPKPNINATLDAETAELLASELGVEVDFRKQFDLETQLLPQLEEAQDDPAQLELRPPVVTFLGHVDHGKTSLLDKIIGIDVASGESGGITQHIRAYRIEKDGRPIAFVDTPGHEAFTEMRARGANVTDIAVLVVAADDGVMPQTEEAVSHARAAGVPIVVALNKIDLPGINTERIYQQLAANDLLPTEWGGETEVVKCSAITGVGLDKLLETLLLTAELQEYKANPQRAAIGTCLEAELHEGRGVVAKMIVQNGTLKVGDVIVCGTAAGHVKAMYDTLKPRVNYDDAGPSTPVNLTGLDVPPAAGERFYVLDNIAAARGIALKRAQELRQTSLGGGGLQHVTLENLHERLGKSQVQLLNLILRADVRGSIEAILKELTKLEHPEVQVKVLQATVGGVTEADVHLAHASDAIIIGFNVVPDEGARTLAQRLGVQIRRYDIIYQVTGDLKAALEGMLRPEKREVDLGRALVQRTFSISRLGTIAGCRVLAGTIERNCRLRVIRESRIIGVYPCESLKREKDDAREVREGLECGIKLGGFNDLKEGDVLEAYKIEEVARTI